MDESAEKRWQEQQERWQEQEDREMERRRLEQIEKDKCICYMCKKKDSPSLGMIHSKETAKAVKYNRETHRHEEYRKLTHKWCTCKSCREGYADVKQAFSLVKSKRQRDNQIVKEVNPTQAMVEIAAENPEVEVVNAPLVKTGGSQCSFVITTDVNGNQWLKKYPCDKRELDANESIMKLKDGKEYFLQTMRGGKESEVLIMEIGIVDCQQLFIHCEPENVYGFAVCMFVEIARCLDILHANNMMHCDIKPNNIVVRRNGSFALMDFGWVKEIGEGKVVIRSENIGNDQFRAPEANDRPGLMINRTVTPALDVWCLAWTAVAVVTLLRTKNRPTPADVSRVLFNFSPIEDLVKACLSEDPEKRPSAHDIVQNEFVQKFLSEKSQYGNQPARVRIEMAVLEEAKKVRKMLLARANDEERQKRKVVQS